MLIVHYNSTLVFFEGSIHLDCDESIYSKVWTNVNQKKTFSVGYSSAPC